ncbi:putative baseplate assembly protein [Variovorax sp. Sphag1AA]|uniref:putative baseplate assembly protein n=1 Tax=Variovorax sp. Sphag1AA TaxID=2587027 RepID=UPI0016125BFE|nr:putative baseplate assembly protein [Variovorax sp. Sphag1AA]MBB3178406.1 putative phage baseplate assembly protein [Variovorax sp. Sphag1AA]
MSTAPTSLDTCGACAGTSPQTPGVVTNRAGLSSVSYRVGTQPLFKESMQARLGTLPELRTRDPGDFTLGLIDAWASVADVLSFYQERIANESFLRTATERRSLAGLAELVGYVPQPGVAAGTWLAFTMMQAPGTPGSPSTSVDIPAGTRVQSIPLPGGLPQTFETTETVPARVEWNAFRPSLTVEQTVDADTTDVLLNGVSSGLKAGDSVIVAPDEAGSRPVLRTVSGVTPMAAEQQTRITLRPAISGAQVPAPAPPPPHKLRPLIALESLRIDTVPLHIATTFAAPRNWSFVTQQVLAAKTPFIARADDLKVFGWRFGLKLTHLFRTLAAWSPPAAPSVYALRAKASLFGYNAPDPRSLPAAIAGAYKDDISTGGDWQPPTDTLDPLLDATYARIAPGGFAALRWSDSDGDHWVVANVDGVAEHGIAKYTMSGKVTQLRLSVVGQSDSGPVSVSYPNFSSYRGATLQAESEALPLARLPNEDPLPAGSQIDLDTWVDGLYAGQRLIVTGELDDSPGNVASEMVQIQSVEHAIGADGGTTLTLVSALTQAYVRKTVTINGNVAAATHGSAVSEVVGSGNASVPSQRFTLRQSPLTYVSAATPSGVASTLALRVNSVRWREVHDFYASAPGDRVYVARLNDDGSTSLTFGDGVNGARPPTGTENIVASYRKGIGAVGNVAAGQLTLLQTRPLGVQGVINPTPATGGTDAETADDIRINAALGLSTLGRIVSLQDYEDFARAFGGIAKALATWTWHGQTRGVFLTVAGIGGAGVEPDGAVFGNLLSAIGDAAEPGVPVKLSSYRRGAFTFSANLMVDPAWDMDAVLAAAQQAARDTFSFARRSFGQPVTRSEIIALLQGVPGVVAVQVSALRRTDTALFVAASRLAVLRENAQIDAALPQVGSDASVLAAELLTLDPRPLNLVATWAEAPP